MEVVGIGGAHAWGDVHSGKKDLAGGVSGMNGIDNRLEVVAGIGNGDTAKPIVGAEFEEEDVGGLAEGPVDAALSIGSRFAADAGVDDLVRQMKGVDAVANESGESLTGFEPVACGEAVAEEDDGFAGV